MLHGVCMCVRDGCGIFFSDTGITGPLVFRHTWPCLKELSVGGTCGGKRDVHDEHGECGSCDDHA